VWRGLLEALLLLLLLLLLWALLTAVHRLHIGITRLQEVLQAHGSRAAHLHLLI
jgi:hypothetical protein